MHNVLSQIKIHMLPQRSNWKLSSLVERIEQLHFIGYYQHSKGTSGSPPRSIVVLLSLMSGLRVSIETSD